MGESKGKQRNFGGDKVRIPEVDGPQSIEEKLGHARPRKRAGGGKRKTHGGGDSRRCVGSRTGRAGRLPEKERVGKRGKGESSVRVRREVSEFKKEKRAGVRTSLGKGGKVFWRKKQERMQSP